MLELSFPVFGHTSSTCKAGKACTPVLGLDIGL